MPANFFSKNLGLQIFFLKIWACKFFLLELLLPKFFSQKFWAKYFFQNRWLGNFSPVKVSIFFFSTEALRLAALLIFSQISVLNIISHSIPKLFKIARSSSCLGLKCYDKLEITAPNPSFFPARLNWPLQLYFPNISILNIT